MTPQERKVMELALETSKNKLTALKLANEQEHGFIGCIPSHWADKAKQIAEGPIAYPNAERAQQAIALIKVLLKSTPPQRTFVGLTDDEIRHIYICTTGWSISDNNPMLVDFAENIETKLKEKNGF